MICGLLRPSDGKVMLNHTDITHLPLHKRSNLGIGYLPQESSIFKDLSVEENLMLAAEISIKNIKDRHIKSSLYAQEKELVLAVGRGGAWKLQEH